MTSNGDGIKTDKCRQNRVNYFAKCKTCELEGKERVYFGETARNLHVRSLEHYNGLKNECRNNFMYKHIVNEHKGEKHVVEFEWGINAKFVKPLERQLSEAISIENTCMKESLNSKMEYFHQNVRKIGLNDHQCNSCGRKFDSLTELEQHKNHVHTRFRCKSCDYTSYGERDLSEHNKIHHVKMLYSCEKCDHVSESEKNLKSHIDTEHEDKTKGTQT